MNDLVMNLLPIEGNRGIFPTISSAMNRSTFNTTCFNSGCQLVTPSIPKFFGALPNGGGGWVGGGILGTYYSNNNYTGTSFGRTDVRIDVPPTTVLPGGSLATDPVYGAVGATNFSAKWVGGLIPKYTQTYALKVRTGGTLTLRIGGSTVATAGAADGWVSAGYAFTANQTYAVEVDMVQGTGPWAAQVHWLGAGLVPFPEEAIGPATPIGVNLTNFLDDKNSTANGGLFASYKDHLGGSTGPAIDSSGWPTGDFAFDQMSTPNDGTGPYSFPHGFSSDARTGVWTVSFNGAAELYTNNTGQFLIGVNDGGRTAVTLNSLTYYSYNQDLLVSKLTYDSTTGTGYNPATNTTVVLFDLRGGGWDNVGFRNTDRNGKGAPGGPTGTAVPGLTNVVCMRPKTVGSTTPYAVGTALYGPSLAMLAPYTAVRELASAYDLDYVASVASPPTDWANRGTPVFNVNASNKNQYPNTISPWEVRVMTANQAGKDLYINLPQTASGNAGDSNYSSSYIYQLASLIKNGGTLGGVTYPGLLPHLCVYVEYGNENWNSSAPSGPYGGRGNVVWDTYFNEQANTTDWQQYSAMGGWVSYGGTPPNVSTNTETLWTALKAKDASDLFGLVFGDAAMPDGLNPDPRVRPLFEWQYGGDFNVEGYDANTALSAISSYFGVAPNSIYWGGGGGWYLTANTSGSTADQVFANITPASALAIWTGNVSGETNKVQGDVDRTARWGLRHVGYEGGFNFGPDNGASSDGQQQASDDARIGPYVELILDAYFQAGGSFPLVFQADGGPYGFGQGWSVIDGMWDGPPYATAPPKLQSYVDSGAELPASVVAPAAWQVVPFAVVSGQGYHNNAILSQTFVVPTPGYYSAGFLVSAANTYASGTIAMSIDGVQIGVLTTPNANGGQSLWVPVFLADGVHNFFLSFSNENPTTGQIAFSTWGVR